MAIHQESAAKAGIRDLLLKAGRALQRSDLVYMGMPAEDALDIKALRPILGSAICIATEQEALTEAARSIATIPLKPPRFYKGDAWRFLKEEYPKSVTADITYLDFYGGGIRESPFQTEVAALRSYFVHHAATKNRAFLFAWTYMPRDAGTQNYERAVKFDRLKDTQLRTLRRLTGLNKRSYAIRLILARMLMENEFQVSLYHHAVYKKTMNALVLVFSKGTDPNSKIPLVPASVEAIVDQPYIVYTADGKAHAKMLQD